MLVQVSVDMSLAFECLTSFDHPLMQDNDLLFCRDVLALVMIQHMFVFWFVLLKPEQSVAFFSDLDVL